MKKIVFLLFFVLLIPNVFSALDDLSGQNNLYVIKINNTNIPSNSHFPIYVRYTGDNEYRKDPEEIKTNTSFFDMYKGVGILQNDLTLNTSGNDRTLVLSNLITTKQTDISFGNLDLTCKEKKDVFSFQGNPIGSETFINNSNFRSIITNYDNNDQILKTNYYDKIFTKSLTTTDVVFNSKKDLYLEIAEGKNPVEDGNEITLRVYPEENGPFYSTDSNNLYGSTFLNRRFVEIDSNVNYNSSILKIPYNLINSKKVLIKRSSTLPPSNPLDIIADPDPLRLSSNYETFKATGSTTIDGSNIQYFYRFESNTTIFQDYSLNNLLIYDETNLKKGDVVKVSVKAYNGNLYSDSYSENFTIFNSIPVVSKVKLQPDKLYEHKNIFCSYEYNDADNDINNSIIKWFINGVEEPSYQGLTSLNYTQFDSLDTIKCEVTPYDGEDYGDKKQSLSSQVNPINPEPPEYIKISPINHQKALYNGINFLCNAKNSLNVISNEYDDDIDYLYKFVYIRQDGSNIETEWRNNNELMYNETGNLKIESEIYCLVKSVLSVENFGNRTSQSSISNRMIILDTKPTKPTIEINDENINKNTLLIAESKNSISPLDELKINNKLIDYYELPIITDGTGSLGTIFYNNGLLVKDLSSIKEYDNTLGENIYFEGDVKLPLKNYQLGNVDYLTGTSEGWKGNFISIYPVENDFEEGWNIIKTPVEKIDYVLKDLINFSNFYKISFKLNTLSGTNINLNRSDLNIILKNIYLNKYINNPLWYKNYLYINDNPVDMVETLEDDLYYFNLFNYSKGDEIKICSKSYNKINGEFNNYYENFEGYDIYNKSETFKIKYDGLCTGSCSFEMYIDNDNSNKVLSYKLNPNSYSVGNDLTSAPVVEYDFESEHQITKQSNFEFNMKDYYYSGVVCLMIEDSNQNEKDLCYIPNDLSKQGNNEYVNLGKEYGFDNWFNINRNVYDDFKSIYYDVVPNKILGIKLYNENQKDSNNQIGFLIDKIKLSNEYTEDYSLYFSDDMESYDSNWVYWISDSSFPVDYSTLISGNKIIMGYENHLGQDLLESKYLMREWNNLPEHSKLKINFNLYEIDGFDGKVKIKIDDEIEKIINVSSLISNEHNIQGKVNNDIIYSYTLELNHNKDDINIKIYPIVSGSTSDKSIGIDNFEIFIENDENLYSDLYCYNSLTLLDTKAIIDKYNKGSFIENDSRSIEYYDADTSNDMKECYIKFYDSNDHNKSGVILGNLLTNYTENKTDGLCVVNYNLKEIRFNDGSSIYNKILDYKYYFKDIYDNEYNSIEFSDKFADNTIYDNEITDFTLNVKTLYRDGSETPTDEYKSKNMFFAEINNKEKIENIDYYWFIDNQLIKSYGKQSLYNDVSFNYDNLIEGLNTVKDNSIIYFQSGKDVKVQSIYKTIDGSVFSKNSTSKTIQDSETIIDSVQLFKKNNELCVGVFAFDYDRINLTSNSTFDKNGISNINYYFNNNIQSEPCISLNDITNPTEIKVNVDGTVFNKEYTKDEIDLDDIIKEKSENIVFKIKNKNSSSKYYKIFVNGELISSDEISQNFLNR